MRCLIFVTVALIVFVAADEEWKPITGRDNILKIHDDCRKEVGLTDEQYAQILRKERPDVKEVHEYVLCNVKKLGLFTEDKGYDPNRLMAQFKAVNRDEEQSREVIQKCVDKNEQKSTLALWAYRGHICLMKNRLEEQL